MNKIYKVVWNATRGCYVVASELVKTHQGKKSTRRGGSILSRAGTALLLAIAGWGRGLQFHLCGRDGGGSEEIWPYGHRE